MSTLQPQIEIFNPYVEPFSSKETEFTPVSIASSHVITFIKNGIDKNTNKIVCKCTPCQCCACR